MKIAAIVVCILLGASANADEAPISSDAFNAAIEKLITNLCGEFDTMEDFHECTAERPNSTFEFLACVNAFEDNDELAACTRIMATKFYQKAMMQ